MVGFNQWLRSSREKAKLGVRELARNVGVSATYISRLESLVSPVTPSALLISRLSVALGADDLEGYECAGVLPWDIHAWVLSGGAEGWREARRASSCDILFDNAIRYGTDRLLK
jgi:transcriptional regulator with XRE-family HTH domain